jgi:hypothetical protein
MPDTDLTLVGQLRGNACTATDGWASPDGMNVEVSDDAITVKWTNPPIGVDEAFIAMGKAIEDRLGAQFLRTGVYAGVVWGQASVRTGTTTTQSVLAGAMLSEADKLPLSGVPDYGPTGDLHPEFRIAMNLVREASNDADPRPKTYMALEALRIAQGGDSALAAFLGKPKSYVNDLKASLQEGRHIASPAPTKLSPNECLQRAREVLSDYAARV